MCGITGLIYYADKRPVQVEELKPMCDSLLHRGPDDEGFIIDGHVGLAVRRLCVIDVETGHQPMTDEAKNIWIVFNGEIYNYLELRKTLQTKGHIFKTNSDTETIIHAYKEYGETCVKHLNGMFAFAIWDSHKQVLFLARDRFGIKPLYYHLSKDCLIFGSEPKALLAHGIVPRSIDLDALDSYLTFDYIPAPLSIFQSVKKLQPAHTLILQDGNITIEQYWNLAPADSPCRISEDEICHELYDLLRDATRLRLNSDVPLGAFLSGGIDSSTIVAMMADIMVQPVKTFSIGFGDKYYDETPYARAVANHCGTDHQEMIIGPDIVGLVDELVNYLDEPLGDVSIFPTYLVSRLARQRVTVALTGDGGDELFAGYDWYVADKIERQYRRLPAYLRYRWLPRFMALVPPANQKKGLINKIKRFVDGAANPALLQHYRWNIYLTEANKNSLYNSVLLDRVSQADTFQRILDYFETAKAAEPLWQQQFADINTFLVDDILLKVDRMSMANSLEARTPFLDHRLVEFVSALPGHLKLRNLQSKYVLKKCMRGKLPRETLERTKEGFSVPMKNWLKHELRPIMQDTLSVDRIKSGGLFNPGYIDRLVKEHISCKENHSHKLWPLILFEIWRNAYQL